MNTLRTRDALTRLGCMALLTTMLGACAGGFAYRRPEVTLPVQWQTGGVLVDSAPTRAPWWSSFQNAELDRLIKAVLEGNRDVMAAGSRIAQARALAQIDGASLMPTLSAGGNASREKRANTTQKAQYQSGLSATYELDVWGKNQRARDAALSRVHSSVHAQRALSLALQAAVAVTYFQLLSAQDQVAVAKSTLVNAESVLNLLHVQHQAGAVSKLEVVRQQGLVASVKADLEPILQRRQQANDALAVLMGRHPYDLKLSSTPLSAVKLPTVAAGLPSSLLENRPDIAQAEADLVAADADLAAARAALFPSLKLTAAGGVESAALSLLLRPSSVIYSLAASLTAPIFDGGRLRGQVAFNQARKDELVHTYHQAILRALRDVENSLSASQHLAAQAAHQAEVVNLALEAHKMADLRYRNGAVDFATVLDAQRVLLAAQATQSAVTLARFTAAVDLNQSMGGSWLESSQTPREVSVRAR